MKIAEIKLKPGREKSVLRRHPWIFSGAVDEITGSPGSGETVCVKDSTGKFLCWGAYSPISQIRVRIWSWKEGEKIDDDFIFRRLSRAINNRAIWFGNIRTNAKRLIFGESDGLPGLIVDQYASVLVIQCLSAGIELWRDEIATSLLEITDAQWIYERSDVEVRGLEGLPKRSGIVQRSKFALDEEFSPLIQIHENGLHYWVDIQHGHKTGFYLDQRANRRRISGITKGKQVLDCFSYTGGFSLNAVSGASESVTALEISSEAIRLGKKNLELNGYTEDHIEWLEGDVFRELRRFRDERRTFDLIILDPPKFARTTSQVQKATRGYKDINLLAFKLLRPEGILVTFSCSGRVSEELFKKVVAGAALDAGAQARVMERLNQDIDHPVMLNYPEGAYLKGLIIQIA